MTGVLGWSGPPRTKPAPWTGRRVRGRGKARGLNVRTRPGDQPIVEVGGEIDVHSAAELRDQLLRVMRRYSPCVARLGSSFGLERSGEASTWEFVTRIE